MVEVFFNNKSGKGITTSLFIKTPKTPDSKHKNTTIEVLYSEKYNETKQNNFSGKWGNTYNYIKLGLIIGVVTYLGQRTITISF